MNKSFLSLSALPEKARFIKDSRQKPVDTIRSRFKPASETLVNQADTASLFGEIKRVRKGMGGLLSGMPLVNSESMTVFASCAELGIGWSSLESKARHLLRLLKGLQKAKRKKQIYSQEV